MRRRTARPRWASLRTFNGAKSHLAYADSVTVCFGCGYCYRLSSSVIRSARNDTLAVFTCTNPCADDSGCSAPTHKHLCGTQEPQAAHHHEPVIDKMRHNFGGGNQTVRWAPVR